MKNLFNSMNDENILMKNDSINIDIDKIKKMTMDKVNADKKIKHISFRKTLALVASFMLILSGLTVLANPSLRNYFSEILGFSPDDVLLVGEVYNTEDYSLTIESMLYDGTNCSIAYSISGISEKGKNAVANYDMKLESYEEDVNYDIDHLIVPLELSYYATIDRNNSDFYYSVDNSENKLIFELNFINPMQDDYAYIQSENRAIMLSVLNLDGDYFYDDGLHSSVQAYNLSRIDELTLNFYGTENNVKIPLTKTIESTQKKISVEATDEHPVEYTSITYSDFGFTLTGKMEDPNYSYENNTIDIVYLHRSFNLVTSYYDNPISPLNPPKGGVPSSKVLDYEGKKMIDYSYMNDFSNVRENSLYREGINFLSDDYMQYHDGENFIVESNFRFEQSFDWSEVEAIIINGTRIDL